MTKKKNIKTGSNLKTPLIRIVIIICVLGFCLFSGCEQKPNNSLKEAGDKEICSDSLGVDSALYKECIVYYKSGGIKAKYVRNEQGLFHGKYFAYYRNGKPREMGQFVMNMPVEKFEFYRKDGTIEQLNYYQLTGKQSYVINEQVLFDKDQDVIEKASFYHVFDLVEHPNPDSLYLIIQEYLPRNKNVEYFNLIVGKLNYLNQLIDSAYVSVFDSVSQHDTVAIKNYLSLNDEINGYTEEILTDVSVPKDTVAPSNKIYFTYSKLSN